MQAAQTGEKNGNRKYKPELIREVKIKMANGISLDEISKETGIGVNYLNQIKYGYKWASLSIETDELHNAKEIISAPTEITSREEENVLFDISIPQNAEIEPQHSV